MKNAALYARVSTAHQEKEATIDSQIDEVKSRIEQDGNLLAHNHIYADEGYSGAIIERPDLDRMRDDARDKKFEVLYVYDRGRLSRNFAYQEVVKDELEACGVAFVSLHDAEVKSPEDKVMQGLQGLFHEYERIKIAERFRRGKMYKAKSGKIVGYNAPYGYRYNKESGQFEIDEHEAKVVKTIFEWVGNEGIPTREVIRRLYDEGIKPRKQKRDTWTKGPVARILRNESYIGKHHYNKSESVISQNRKEGSSKYRKVQKTGRIQRPRDEWIEFDVPRLVSDELFEKVQKRLEHNKKFAQRNKKNKYLFGGVIECTCGSKRVGEGVKDKLYYRCTDRLRRFPLPRECFEGGINASVMDATAWAELEDFLTNPELIMEQAEKWFQENESTTSAKNSGQNYSQRLKELAAEQKRYVEAYGKGLIPASLFEEQINKVSREKKRIESKLAETQKKENQLNSVSLEEIVERATHEIEELDYSEKRFIVERLVDKVIATKEKVSIWGHIPVPAFAGIQSGKVGLRAEYRDRRTAKRR